MYAMVELRASHLFVPTVKNITKKEAIDPKNANKDSA